MRSAIICIWGFAVILFAWGLLTPKRLEAYPGFGKKINPELSQSCMSCHVVYPKLRLYGKTIREIGYNVPVNESEEGGLKKLYRALPLALRAKVDITDDQIETGLNAKEIQLLSGGNAFNNRISWWFHKHIVEDNEFVSLTEGIPHESWLQYNQADALHVRMGMFELPLWFSPSKTKVSEIPYLYYGTTTNEGNLGLLSGPQFGIQANGHIGKGSAAEDEWGAKEDDNYAEGYNYAVSVTNGETSFEGDFNTIFGRITRKNPLYSIGIFALTGSGEVMGMEAMDHADEDHEDHETEAANQEVQKEVYYRIGTDMDLYLRGDDASLHGSFAYGKDFERNYLGGFVGYDHLIKRKLFLSLRYDAVRFTGDEHHQEDHQNDHEMEPDGHEAAHIHGEIISDNANSVSLGIHYLLYGNVRIGMDYRYGVDGVDSKGMLQLQFAL